MKGVVKYGRPTFFQSTYKLALRTQPDSVLLLQQGLQLKQIMNTQIVELSSYWQLYRTVVR